LKDAKPKEDKPKPEKVEKSTVKKGSLNKEGKKAQVTGDKKKTIKGDK
jgi:hypothetical protein